MITIANRLRGTYGWFASVFGACIAIAIYLATKNIQVALLLGVGYWFGEMICGWGSPIGLITVKRWGSFDYFPEDGENVGVRWITSMITHPRLWRLHLSNAKIGIRNIYPKIKNSIIDGVAKEKLFKYRLPVVPIVAYEIDNALRYSRVFLVIRGIYWWTLPAIGAAMIVGAVPAIVALVVLSLGWPVAAELGYYIGEVKKKQLHKWVLSYAGGWEWQEGFYGLMQDLVLIGGICYVMV